MNHRASLVAIVREYEREAQEHCEQATRAILALEQGSDDPDLFDAVGRALHALKGSTGTLGLASVSHVAHRAEDLLAESRRRGDGVRGVVTDVLLEAFDAILTGVRLAGETGQVPVTFPMAGVLAHIEQAIGGTETRLPLDSRPSVHSERAPGSRVTDSWRVDAAHVESLVKDVGRVRELHLRMERRRRELEELGARLTAPAAPEDAAREARYGVLSVSASLRADGDQAAETIASLEQSLRSIATQSMRTLLDPLHRAVRDLSRQTGKEAQLSLVGEELAIDRRVLEALRGALAQLIRNAMAHGIELPEVRERLGKHRVGAVVVRAEQAGNTLRLTVEDDGNGVDLERVRRAAVKKKLLSTDVAGAMDRAALLDLLCRPGFSTLEDTSEVGGRGFGLDVVRTAVGELRGRMDIETVAGQSTRFVLTLPIGFGTSPLLVVRSADQLFGLPMVSAESAVVMREEQLLEGPEARMRLASEALPLRDLGALLGVRDHFRWRRGQPVVVFRHKTDRVALAIDEVVGSFELPVHPLPPETGDASAWAGAASLVLGEIVLVVQPAWLLRHSKELPEPLAAGGLP